MTRARPTVPLQLASDLEGDGRSQAVPEEDEGPVEQRLEHARHDRYQVRQILAGLVTQATLSARQLDGAQLESIWQLPDPGPVGGRSPASVMEAEHA